MAPAQLDRSRVGAVTHWFWGVVARTVRLCFQHRVTGLAAEAAFFAILSLPPLVFGLAGTIGFVAERYDVAQVDVLRDRVLDLFSRALTPDTVDAVIAPTLNDVLESGRIDVISIGFVLALWSGSRALNVFIDTITIIYGLGGQRGIVKTRALSFALYVVALLVGIALVPLVLAGPDVAADLVPDRVAWVRQLYWPAVLVLSVGFIATLYHTAVPVRRRWRMALPGAAFTLLLWVFGSFFVRWALGFSTGGTSIYGPLAAPIAVLLWLYVISIAVLIGAAINAAIDDEVVNDEPLDVIEPPEPHDIDATEAHRLAGEYLASTGSDLVPGPVSRDEGRGVWIVAERLRDKPDTMLFGGALAVMADGSVHQFGSAPGGLDHLLEELGHRT